jgi:hypothetical protein
LAIKGVAGNLSRVLIGKNATFLGTRGETAPNVTVALDFIGSGPQSLSASSNLDLHEVSATEESQLTLETSGNNVTLTLGSNTGGGLMLQNGSWFDLTGNTLSLRGAATVNRTGSSGYLKVNNATLEIASASNAHSNLFFDDTLNAVHHLGVNLTGNGRAVIQSPLKINNSLKVSGGDLNANGNITLISTEEKTANLEEIENDGRVVGDMIVQRYISGKERTYRYMSSPVAGVTIGDWQNYFAITGPFNGSSTGPGLGTASSLFFYDEPNWVGYPTTTNEALIQKGVGYAVLIRNAEPILLENVGTPYQGTFQFSVKPPVPGNADTGWNLLGNPYASTIEWSNDPQAWQRSDISSVVAVMNNANATTSQFMYYDASTGLGTGRGGVLAGGRIAQSQAFYVQATGPSPSLTINEEAKSQGQQTFFRMTEQPVSHLMLRLKSGETEDAAIVSLTEFANDEFEPELDGKKQANKGMFNLSTLSSNDHALAINNLNDAYCSKSIKLNITDAPAGKYTLFLEDISSLSGVGSITLVDNFAKEHLDFLEAAQYSFEITADDLSFGNNRFELLLERPQHDLSLTARTESACGAEGKIILNGSQRGAIYAVIDSKGRHVAVENGTGGELHFTVEKEYLKEGSNSFSIETSFKGCQAHNLPGVVVIEFANAPYVMSSDVSVCKGEKARIEVSSSLPDVAYRWYTASGTEIKGAVDNVFESEPVEAETFLFVSAESANGCQGPKQIIILTPEEVETPELRLISDTLLTATVAGYYIWSLNGEELAVTGQPFYPARSNGQYTVTCVSGGCIKMSSVFEVTSFEKGDISSISLYPNPATSDNIFLKGRMDRDQVVKITIIDLMGKEVFNTVKEGSLLEDGLQVVPAMRLKAGIYFLILEENSRKRKIKFIIRE